MLAMAQQVIREEATDSRREEHAGEWQQHARVQNAYQAAAMRRQMALQRRRRRRQVGNMLQARDGRGSVMACGRERKVMRHSEIRWHVIWWSARRQRGSSINRYIRERVV